MSFYFSVVEHVVHPYEAKKKKTLHELRIVDADFDKVLYRRTFDTERDAKQCIRLLEDLAADAEGTFGYEPPRK